MNITKTSPAAPTPASVATNAARSAAPARDASAATVVATATPKTAAAGTAPSVAGESVSVSKVAQMRAAIESGTFKVDAGKIADGLIRSGDLAR